MLIVREETIILILGAMVIIGLFRLIRWIVRSVWYLLTGRGENKVMKQSRDSGDWLTNAQVRQEARFENSLPPLRSEAKPQKKTMKEKWNESHGRSATGWTFNEETQLWEPPKNMKK